MGTVLRRRKLALAIAMVLACIGGAYHAARLPAAALAGTAPAPGAMPPVSVGRAALTPSTSVAPSASSPALDALMACDLTAPAPEANEAQQQRDTQEQKRYDLALARRLHATGNPIEQAVSSLLGRIEDWDPRELADHVASTARAAVMTSDPQLYGLALNACARLQDRFSPVAAPEACAQLSGDQLTLLQPDNAVAWLNAAALAREKQDTATELDALYHAGQAVRRELPGAAAIGMLRTAMAPTDPAWLRYGSLRVLSEEIAPNGGWGMFHEAQRLAASCTVDAADANRRELCATLADNLSRQVNGSAILKTTAAVIGISLGWPDNRLVPLYRTIMPQFTAGRTLKRTPFPPHDCRAGVHLAILEAILATDSPTRMSAPNMQALLVSLDAMWQETSNDAETATGESTEDSSQANQ